MQKIDRPKIIVITGAESTGKTQLARELSTYFNCPWIPEFAREYIGYLNRRYSYADVEKVLIEQVKEYESALKMSDRFVFLDTWLIITKVWFEVVFNKKPDWLVPYIQNAYIDLFLVCDTDIEWIQDPLRENGGEMREKLYTIYLKNLQDFRFKYAVIQGTGKLRLSNAVSVILENFNSDLPDNNNFEDTVFTANKLI